MTNKRKSLIVDLIKKRVKGKFENGIERILEPEEGFDPEERNFQ